MFISLWLYLETAREMFKMAPRHTVGSQKNINLKGGNDQLVDLQRSFDSMVYYRSNVVEVNVITDYISKCWLHESNRFD